MSVLLLCSIFWLLVSLLSAIIQLCHAGHLPGRYVEMNFGGSLEFFGFFVRTRSLTSAAARPITYQVATNGDANLASAFVSLAE